MLRIRGQKARIEAGNVTSHLDGDALPLQAIDEETSFHIPGYQYMPRYVAGQWDGRKHLLDRKHKTFPAGLTSRVSAVLTAQGVQHTVHEEPLPESVPITVAEPVIELRPYQVECIEAALEARRGVLEMATGAGKTAVAACIIHRLSHPAMFFVHTRDLLHQTRRTFEKMLGVRVGQVGDGVVDLRPVTVATIQTCAKALGIKIEKAADDDALENDKTDIKTSQRRLLEAIRDVPVVFFDECHHLPADCCYSLAMQTKAAAYRFGLSATPYRSDRQDLLLEAAIGPKIYRANASVLIDQGYLVAPLVRFHAVPALHVVGRRPEYNEVFEDYIVRNPRRNGMIAEHARALEKKRVSVLILVSQVAHGEELQALMPGVPLVQGSDPSPLRQEVFGRLERKEQMVVIATTLADEGLDIPTLGAVVLASGGKSETRALQRVGRSLRPSPGKKQAVVVDFFDNAPFLREHSIQRLEIFRTEPAFRVETVGFKA
jgi:superfamily II DNA or RNA helicase